MHVDKGHLQYAPAPFEWVHAVRFGVAWSKHACVRSRCLKRTRCAKIAACSSSRTVIFVEGLPQSMAPLVVVRRGKRRIRS